MPNTSRSFLGLTWAPRDTFPGMGRPPNEIGTHGNVRTYRLAPDRWQARTLVRDPDGRTREVKRNGKSESAATRALKAAIRDRVHATATGTITPDTRFSEAADTWLTDPSTRKLSPNTYQQYARVLRVHIKPGLGGLRCREFTVPTASAFLATIETRRGAPTARMCRSVLSGIGSWLAIRGAITSNPVRDTGRITAKPSRRPRALTLAEARDLVMWLGYCDDAIRRDIPDFLRFMLATGLRVGEAAAVRIDDVDMGLRVVMVTGNIVRITGEGLIRQEDESSKLHPRVLDLPPWAVGMLRARQELRATKPGCPLFPAQRGGWRDPSNTAADVRDALDWCGYQWATSHTLRRTVATLMDVEGGLSPRAGADQLGHANPGMTMSRYWGRGATDTGAASVLQRIEDDT